MARALVERSKEVIRDGQAPSGAYVACPEFPPYRYCWFRDGSFVADAISRVGDVEGATAFFDWCATVIRARPRGPWDARYTLEGDPEESEWPKHQLDGLGLWLWALRGHCDRHGIAPGQWQDAIDATTTYLRDHWRERCIDWW